MDALAFLLCSLPALVQESRLPLSLENLHDATEEGYAFVEVEAYKPAYFVHEEIALRLRFGFEAEFLRTNLVQLFHRELDVPAQIQADWLVALPDSIPVSRAASQAQSGLKTVAIGDDVRQAELREERSIDGLRFAVMELECGLLPLTPGVLELTAPRLRFAYAEAFEEDVFRGTVPAERVDAFVLGNPVALRIRPLPEEGRPPEFGGLVGRITASVEVAAPEVELGQAFELRLQLDGCTGNQEIEPPRLRWDDLHVLAVREEAPGRHRSFLYDLQPTNLAVERIPSISVVYFDPDVAAYRTLDTPPVPIRVRPSGRGLPGVPPDGSEASADSSIVKQVVLASFLLVAALVPLLLWKRTRGLPRSEPERVRFLTAIDAYRRRGKDSAADPAQAFTALLSAGLDLPPAAVVGGRLTERLLSLGLPEGVAARASEHLNELMAPRYGGAPVPSSVERAEAWVDAVAAHLE